MKFLAEFHAPPARAVLIARRAMRAASVSDVRAQADGNGAYGRVLVRFKAVDLDAARGRALIMQGVHVDGMGRVRRDLPWPLCGRWSDLNDT